MERKCKIIAAGNITDLEAKVNKFLEEENIAIIDMQYRELSVMVIYSIIEESGEDE